MPDAPLLHFVHTDEFDESLSEIPLADAELRTLQDMLRENPEAGDRIPKTGGIRKVRLPAKGKGTRAGARVIYYYVARRLTVYLMFAYAKGVADDLSEAGKRHLRAVMEAIEREA